MTHRGIEQKMKILATRLGLHEWKNGKTDWRLPKSKTAGGKRTMCTQKMKNLSGTDCRTEDRQQKLNLWSGTRLDLMVH
jgi:hypothetical protein